jgi:hypothetical protein
MVWIVAQRDEAEFYLEISSGLVNRIDLNRADTDVIREMLCAPPGIDQK